MPRRRHHYVPRVYLKQFCDEMGRIHVYRKDDPKRQIHLAPDNTAFHDHYYSQPLPDGGRDQDSLEELFSTIESKWPNVVRKLAAREALEDDIASLFTFIALQRARVPAARDVMESLDAATVLMTAKALDAAGHFPPKPRGLENIWDHIQIAIDPQRSLESLVASVEAATTVLHMLGFAVVYNRTELPFLTSDNPVIWFDPTLPPDQLRPYGIRRGGPVMFHFPVTPHIMIYGESTFRDRFLHTGLLTQELKDASVIHEINRTICRFAYQAVFANTRGQESLIEETAHESPGSESVHQPTERGTRLVQRQVFGPRQPKPKWSTPKEDK